jgi:prophage regulatory protein
MIQTEQQLTDYLLRRKDVEKIAGISRASIYRLIKAGKFPTPVNLGTGAVRWKQSELIAWQSSLIKNPLGLSA